MAEWLHYQLQDKNNDNLIKDNLKLMKKESVVSQMRTLIGQLSDDDLSEVGIFLAQKLTHGKREEFVEAVSLIPQAPDETAKQPLINCDASSSITNQDFWV